MNDGVIIVDDICNAILQRHLLQFRVGRERMVVEPHQYGVSEGKHLLLAWSLFSAGVGRVPKGGFELFQIEEMREVRKLSETFEHSRPGYGSARLPMNPVHAQLKFT
jgi:hypothetical protein